MDYLDLMGSITYMGYEEIMDNIGGKNGKEN